MSPYIAAGTHTPSKIYHSDEECPYLKGVEQTREVPQTHVERQNRRLCKLCADEEDNVGKNQGEWQEINRKLKDPETTYDKVRRQRSE